MLSEDRKDSQKNRNIKLIVVYSMRYMCPFADFLWLNTYPSNLVPLTLVDESYLVKTTGLRCDSSSTFHVCCVGYNT